MSCPPLDPHFDPEKFKYRADFAMQYDSDAGEVHLIDQSITEIIKVRQSLVDDFVLRATIVELEKRGYTVLSPEALQDEDTHTTHGGESDGGIQPGQACR